MNPIYRFSVSSGENLIIRFSDGYELNKALDINTGNTQHSPYHNTTGMIDISDIIMLQTAFLYPTVFYDRNKKYVWGVWGAGSSPCMFGNRMDVPPMAKYMRVSIPTKVWHDNECVVTGYRQMEPRYKDDISIDYELESNQRFYRKKLSGKVSFVGSDFDWLNKKPFSSSFKLNISSSRSGGKTWDFDCYNGKFMKTDCTWDAHDKIVTIKTDTDDLYRDVLAGLDKEYNLIELAPAMKPLIIHKRPLIQLYVQGDSVLSCFIGGTYWEQPCKEVNDSNKLLRDYYFAKSTEIKEIEVTGSGSYKAEGIYGGEKGKYYRSEGDLHIMYYETPAGGSVNVYTHAIVRSSDNKVLYTHSSTKLLDEIEFKPADGSGVWGSFKGYIVRHNVWLRYLLDREYLDPNTTYRVPTDDITADNLNYRYCIGLVADVAMAGVDLSREPTQWGQNGEGLYFKPPYMLGGSRAFPIAKSKWRNISLWFRFSIGDWIFEPEGRTTYMLRNCYDIASAIQVLLNQFSEGIYHGGNKTYSEFLYGDRNPVSGMMFQLLLTQKSNLLHGSMARPAQKAPITLGDILNMLRDCFRCYWFIDDSGRFRIEHIQWFRNGGTYGWSQGLAVDLKDLINPRNGKPWSLATNNWSFDKVDMPERYQMSWMDDCTDSFEGKPIEVKSKYVTPGKIEDITVSKFTTDVDYMLMNPSEISPDGFALFGAVQQNALTFGIGSYDFYRGIIDTDGVVKRGNNINEIGYGWLYTKASVVGGQEYKLLDKKGLTINSGVYWHFYDIKGKSIKRASTNGGTIVVPDNCYKIGLSFRVQTYSNPGYVPVLDDPYSNIGQLRCSGLSLPFIEFGDFIENDFRAQNGLLSWYTLLPNYYVHDLPASEVLINGQHAHVYGIDRKRKQTVTFPSETDLSPMKLINTDVGSGQIDKLSVNLHSRMVKATLKYDTE